jgi:S-adenosylmethionine hydrolase
MRDAPLWNPRFSAYLLAALLPGLPGRTHCLCVVDPGVGTSREGLALRADGRWLVGPDNGLLAIAGRRAREVAWHRIGRCPASASRTFHGRDWFAPVLAELIAGGRSDLETISSGSVVGCDWELELSRLIYADGYGNFMTGLDGCSVDTARQLRVGDHCIAHAAAFGEVPEGRAFWYVNSCGLVEIAANRVRADVELGLVSGQWVEWV